MVERIFNFAKNAKREDSAQLESRKGMPKKVGKMFEDSR